MRIVPLGCLHLLSRTIIGWWCRGGGGGDCGGGDCVWIRMPLSWFRRWQRSETRYLQSSRVGDFHGAWSLSRRWLRREVVTVAVTVATYGIGLQRMRGTARRKAVA